MKKKTLFEILILLVLTFLLVACGGNASEASVAHDPAQPPHWTYEGAEGPANWGEIDPAYATCGIGISQSPIDISKEAAQDQDLENILFNYQPSEVNILNNGHTVQMNYDAGSYIEIDGIRYDAAQLHYHAPSEHALNGKLFAAELHIVHKSADGALAVVGIMIEEGAENPAYQPLLDNMPAEKSDVTNAGLKINATDLLPVVQTTFRYSGSLTTPPCSEGVNWNVMTTPVQLSADQIAAFTDIFEGNNRPVQSINDRLLVEDTTP